MNLIHSNSILQAIWEHSTLGIVLTDVKGNIVSVNKNIEKITGYKPEEVIGKNPKIFSAGVLPEDFYKNLWDTILKGENWEGIFINRKRNGKIYYEKATISPIKNDKGEIIYFVALKYEITEREELIDTTTQYLAHLIPFGIAVTDHENKIVFVNRELEKIFETNKENVLEKKIDSVFRIFKNEKEINICNLLEKNQSVKLNEVAVTYQSKITIADINALKINRSTYRIGTIFIFEKKIQTKKRNEKGEEVNKLSVFLTGFAHDLNNILAMAEIYLQSAKMYLDLDKGKVKEKLNTVSEKLSQLSDLVSSFFETATSLPVYRKVNLNNLIKEILKDLSKQYPDISFNLKEENPFTIEIDREKIKYSVYHIIKNAIEAQNGKGEIKIILTKAVKPEIVSLHLPEKDYVKIIVKDRGRGIKREFLPLLFTPYFTTKERTSKKQTGLSLAVCNLNIKKHGGLIKVLTEEGKGTEFTIYLPIKQ